MFRFTIRDVLWLMVVVGLGAGWSVDRTRLLAMHAEAEQLRRDEALLAVDEMRKMIELRLPVLESQFKTTPEMDPAIEKARSRRSAK
jgi:hypothetical protein